MKAKLQQLQSTLSKGLVGRDEIMKSALLGVIAGENTLLIGPPGTAKSMLARRVSEAIRQDETQDYFEYLLTKFSTPEEIFGPLSISELKQDRFQRNTLGYLPSVKIGFLDEIFKASSPILNALLTILNERKYHNGTQSVDVPLQSLISASNELPIGQEELSALYDRFLIRRFVSYVGQEQLSNLFDLPKIEAVDEQQRLTVDELKQIREQAKNVQFSNDVRQAIKNIWKECESAFKEDKNEQLSDRRFVKVLHLMRISAITNGRNAVDFSDILLLKDCLWNNPDNQERILQIIKNELKKYDKLVDVAGDDIPQSVEPVASVPLQTPTTIPSQNVIQGFQGSGTADDPILIENINHLQGLQRAEVGQQGYYFKQINDIDCTSINKNSWFKIDFKGHYDGNHKKIIYNSSEKALFDCVEGSIQDLSIENMALAKAITNSDIKNCQSTTHFVLSNVVSSTITSCKAGTIFVKNHIHNSTISYCTSKQNFTTELSSSQVIACRTGSYLAFNVFDSEIRYCQAQSILIMQDVSNSTIECCQVNLKRKVDNNHGDTYVGGIAKCVKDNSCIQYCYVDGQFSRDRSYSAGYMNFSGIVHELQNSTIQYCAVGELQQGNNSHRRHRIVHSHTNSKLAFNISIDTNNWGRDKRAYGKDGESVSSALFNQYYFENTLGWDFDTIWQWDNKANRPTLRQLSGVVHYSGSNTVSTANTTNISSNQNSLLKLQMQNNIWL